MDSDEQKKYEKFAQKWYEQAFDRKENITIGGTRCRYALYIKGTNKLESAISQDSIEKYPDEIQEIFRVASLRYKRRKNTCPGGIEGNETPDFVEDEKEE